MRNTRVTVPGLDDRRGHDTTSRRSVAAIGSLATRRIGYTAAATAPAAISPACISSARGREHEEMGVQRNARHRAKNAVEPDRERTTDRHGGRAAEADEQRRLAEHARHDARPRQPERPQRGQLAELLVHRHRQQHRNQEQPEEQRHGAEHARQLAEVPELHAAEAVDELFVGHDVEAGECRANGRGRRRRAAAGPVRLDEQHVGLVCARAAAQRGHRFGTTRQR